MYILLLVILSIIIGAASVEILRKSKPEFVKKIEEKAQTFVSTLPGRNKQDDSGGEDEKAGED